MPLCSPRGWLSHQRSRLARLRAPRTSFSKSLISSLARQLDSGLEAWRTRPLAAKSYPYLSVYARYEKVRVGPSIVSKGVLIVPAVREDGFKEILAVETAGTESETTYPKLFSFLKGRGLKGVLFVTSDDYEGLKAAIERHFQEAGHQRCRAHYPRDLLGMVPNRMSRTTKVIHKNAYTKTPISLTIPLFGGKRSGRPKRLMFLVNCREQANWLLDARPNARRAQTLGLARLEIR